MLCGEQDGEKVCAIFVQESWKQRLSWQPFPASYSGHNSIRTCIDEQLRVRLTDN